MGLEKRKSDCNSWGQPLLGAEGTETSRGYCVRRVCRGGMVRTKSSCTALGRCEHLGKEAEGKVFIET